MSTVSATTSTTSTTSTSSSTSSSSTSAASSTESEFLSILTTELSNQDPMNAMDTSTFASQLVSYAGLEQQISTNSKLDGITTLLASLAGSSTDTSTSTTS